MQRQEEPLVNLSSKKWVAASGAAMLLASAALAGGAGAVLAQDDEKVTVNWWHIQHTEPLLSVWQDVANEYMAEHPNVEIVITPRENEAFKAAETANMAAGDPPDIFQTWGGGGLKAQAEAGYVKPIDDLVADWIDGVSAGANSLYNVDGTQYGVAFDQGMVGFWYNKDLFEAAGIDEFPTTWAGLLEAVQKLKESGVVPIALGEGEKWPGHFYWAYLAIRNCGADVMLEAAVDGDFNRECFIKAGQDLQDLVELDPFQPDFLAATYVEPTGSAAQVGNGVAAMELMGHWAFNNFKTYSASGQGIGDALAFANFPEVEGGAGTAGDLLGGGNGFAVGANAPDEALDFLRYFSTLDVGNRIGASGQLLPVVIGSADSVVEPTLSQLVGILEDSTSVTLYLDQAYSPAVGEVVNDSVQELFGGRATPEEVAAQITEAAQAEMAAAS